MTVQHKRIIITGGTSGIGLELVKQLASSNQIIVISRQGTLPETLTNTSQSITLYHADLAVKADIERVMHQIQQQHSHIDLLINNAAIQQTPEFLSDDFNFDAIQNEVDVNFTAICHLSYLCLPLLLAAPSASILNVNSGLAIAPKRASAIYCATKSALDTFSKSLSYQLADTSVNVQQVFLPLVETPMTATRAQKNKLTAAGVATEIIRAIENKKARYDIGKVTLLRLINALAPALAQRIMRES